MYLRPRSSRAFTCRDGAPRTPAIGDKVVVRLEEWLTPETNPEGRIIEVESIISRAEVIDFSKFSGKVVKFGATVRLADEDTDEPEDGDQCGECHGDFSLTRAGTEPHGTNKNT